MIGLALVTFVSIFAAGFRASVDEVVDKQFAGDLTVRNKDGFSPIPLGPPGARDVAGVGRSPACASASASSGARRRRRSASTRRPRRLHRYVAEGDDAVMRGLGAGETVATARGPTTTGSRRRDVSAVRPTKRRAPLEKVVGSLDEARAAAGGGLIVANGELERNWDETPRRVPVLAFAATRRRPRARQVDRVSTRSSRSPSRRTARRSRSPGRPDQHDPHPVLRAAGAVGDRLAVRRGQHR
jgi:putative ABC transport system permease protein